MSEPVRIAFCITDLDRGGAELALVQVIRRLDRDRWAPHVYCLTHRGKLADELEELGVPVSCYELGKWNLPLVLWRLRSALKASRPAVVQTFLYHANILGRVAAWMAGVPHVLSGIRVAEKRSWFRLALDRWTDRFVSKHVCVSEGVKRFSVQQGGLPEPKMVVVPNGVDVARFKEAEPANLTEFGIPGGAFTALFVGRLEPQKAPEMLIQGLSPLFPPHPHLHLLMVGAGSLESSLRDRAAALNIVDNVHFAGRQRDIPGIMRSADCLVLTSLWEGMPNVVLEAMAAGLPVVTTDVEGVRELIDSPRTGFIVPIAEPDALQEPVALLIGSEQLRTDMAAAAQVHVSQLFTWDATAAGFVAVYDGLLAT